MDAGEKLVASLNDTIKMLRFRKAGPKMSRLADKLTRAAAVVSEVTASIEARADLLIARKDHLKAREHAAFEPHENLLDGAEKGLNEVEDALRLLSNSPL